VRTVSEVNDLGQIFPTQVYVLPLSVPPREFTLELYNGSSGQNTRVMPTAEGEKSLMICAFAEIRGQCVTDRQTDGQTDRFAITVLLSACWHAGV